MSRATIEILLTTAASSIEVAFVAPPPSGTGHLPAGGAVNALLAKTGAGDYAAGWTNEPIVRGLRFDTANSVASLAVGESRWNAVDKTIETNLDGVTLQHGLELYVRAANFTGVTIPNGKVVAFSGVDTPNEVPKIAPMLADGSIPPLYVIGVTTEDIPDAGTIGRVTTFGEAHSLDTTGTPYGEVWAAGDLLYASPTIPGGFTHTEPPPPAVAVIIAAVVKVDAVNGVLLVRPSLFPRLQYGTFSSSVTQTQTAALTPKAVTFNTVELASGVTVGAGGSALTASASGLYEIEATLQIEKGSSSLGMIWTWLRKNGVDVPRTSTHASISGNGVAAVLSRLFAISLNPGEFVELMWAVDTTTIYLHADAAPAFGPSAPSATIAVVKVNQ
jgi:hypothetical protein